MLFITADSPFVYLNPGRREEERNPPPCADPKMLFFFLKQSLLKRVHKKIPHNNKSHAFSCYIFTNEILLHYKPDLIGSRLPCRGGGVVHLPAVCCAKPSLWAVSVFVKQKTHVCQQAKASADSLLRVLLGWAAKRECEAAAVARMESGLGCRRATQPPTLSQLAGQKRKGLLLERGRKAAPIYKHRWGLSNRGPNFNPMRPKHPCDNFLGEQCWDTSQKMPT